MRRILTPLFAVLLTTTATAQDRPNTILVLDGSGSMWGQIDGVAKITIAQDVITDLLGTLPTDQRLGLMAYGHRERGNCTDIETLVEPGENTRDAIAAAVAGIKPLGKTPMTDSVIAAANALRYTEDSATVILVSDGVETCNPDPCAAARLLEQAGIDFTAHVVGFDVSGDAAALTQMQCIANETGGQFLTAENASELGAALTAVVQDVEPALSQVTFSALMSDDQSIITSPILWDITSDNGVIVDDATGNPYVHDLPQGAYVATAYSVVTEAENTAQFVVVGDTSVDILFDAPPVTASVIAPATAAVGSTIQVGWDGPNEPNDYIGVGPVGGTGSDQWAQYFRTSDGNPNALTMPTTPGDYLIQYFRNADRAILGTHAISLTAIDGSLDAPATAPAGSMLTVPWTGPNYARDYIGVGLSGTTGSDQWEAYAYTADGSPAQIQLPSAPGDYRISYFYGQDRNTLVTQDITLEPAGVTITAPETAAVGTTLTVPWTGPDNESDYIGIGPVGTTGSDRWENYAYTADGTPAQLVMPTATGDYLIQYFAGVDRGILATVPITLSEQTVSVSGPTEALAGSTITVDWTGPDFDNDYIGIGAVGTTGSDRWETYAYTADGTPAAVTVPTVPGDYLVQYFFGQDRGIAATQTLTVLPVDSTVTGPSTAAAGSTISVDWTGPDYDGDYIGVGLAGSTGSDRWHTYAYTADGSPAVVTVPGAAGDYLITYFMKQGQTPLKSQPLAVTQPPATLLAEDSAPAGSDIVVGWDGPDNEGDYIGIGLTGTTGSDRWKTYAYTSAGNPATITLPDVPGNYIIRYFMNQDRTPIAEKPLTVD